MEKRRHFDFVYHSSHSGEAARPLDGQLAEKEGWQFAAQSDGPILNIRIKSTKLHPTGREVEYDPLPEFLIGRRVVDQQLGDSGVLDHEKVSKSS